MVWPIAIVVTSAWGFSGRPLVVVRAVTIVIKLTWSLSRSRDRSRIPLVVVRAVAIGRVDHRTITARNAARYCAIRDRTVDSATMMRREWPGNGQVLLAGLRVPDIRIVAAWNAAWNGLSRSVGRSTLVIGDLGDCKRTQN